VCEILRKFDINSLYICPPYLYTVTMLLWEIQKKSFSTVLFIPTSDYYVISVISTVLFIPTSDYYVISEETNYNCCTAAYLFTYCCLLLPIICVALFYGEFFYLFGQSFSKPSMPLPTHNRLFSASPTFGGTQHYLQSYLKVLHFTR